MDRLVVCFDSEGYSNLTTGEICYFKLARFTSKILKNNFETYYLVVKINSKNATQ